MVAGIVGRLPTLLPTAKTHQSSINLYIFFYNCKSLIYLFRQLDTGMLFLLTVFLQCHSDLGCVREVPGPSRVKIPLSVVFLNKTCLVVDASRHLNPYAEKEHTKLDSLKDSATLVESRDWISVDDMDSDYWHIPLHFSM